VSSVNEEGLHKNKRLRSWPHSCVVLAILLLVVVVVSCALSGAGIQRGAITPINVDRRLGPVQLIALSTLTPDCALAFPCGPPLRVTNPALRRFYVVWVVVIWPGLNGASVHSYRLVMLQLEH
jgi:hypothetical protein